MTVAQLIEMLEKIENKWALIQLKYRDWIFYHFDEVKHIQESSENLYSITND